MAHDHNVNARLSRLETLIDGISSAIAEIKLALNERSRINWAPIAIGVTIFFTVCGSVATIYNARIATLNSAVELLANRTTDLEKGNMASQLKAQTVEERVTNLERSVDDLKNKNTKN